MQQHGNYRLYHDKAQNSMVLPVLFAMICRTAAGDASCYAVGDKASFRAQMKSTAHDVRQALSATSHLVAKCQLDSDSVGQPLAAVWHAPISCFVLPENTLQSTRRWSMQTDGVFSVDVGVMFNMSCICPVLACCHKPVCDCSSRARSSAQCCILLVLRRLLSFVTCSAVICVCSDITRPASFGQFQ